MAISTNGAIITRLAGALYGEYLSNASYTEVSTTAPATVAANFLANDFAGKTDLQVANTILTNLGLTSITGLNNWLSAQLTAAGSTAAAKGAALVSILNGYAGMASDATYGSYATSFNAKVDAALTLSQTAGSKGGAFATADAVVVTNGAFTLTTGTDTVTGNAGNDTINGNLGGTSGTALTFSSSDVIDGGAGNDTLNVEHNSNGGALNFGNVKNVEKLIVVETGAATTVSLPTTGGYTTLESVNSTYDVTFSNIKSASTAVAARNLGATVDVTANYYATTLLGSADNLTVTVESSGTSADPMALNVTGGTAANALETLTVVNQGTASYVDVDVNEANTTKLVVNASEALTLTLADGAANTLKTIDASGSTAGVSVTAINSKTTITGGSGNDTLTGSSGNDTINAGAGNDSLVGSAGNDSLDAGAGNDTVTLDGSATDENDVVSGGEGTDTLKLTAAIGYTTTTNTDDGSGVTGFEKINLSGSVTQNMKALAGNSITGVTLSTAGSVGSLTYASGINAVTYSADSDLTVSLAADGTSDAMAITLAGGTAAAPSDVQVTFTDTDGYYDTLTVASNGNDDSADNTLGLDAAGATSLTITGTQNLVLTGTDVTALETVDASGWAGTTLELNLSTSDADLTYTPGTGVQKVQTGSGNDVITTGSSSDSVTGNDGNDSITAAAGNDTVHGNDGNDTIDGGTGNDSIFGEAGNDKIIGGDGNDTIDAGAGSDSVDGGAGNDSITAGAGSDTLNGGDGNDTFVMSSYLSSADSIDGGNGTDTITATVSANAAPTVTGVETWNLRGGVTNSPTLDLTDVSGVTSITASVTAALTVSEAPSSLATITYGAAAANDLTVGYATSGPGLLTINLDSVDNNTGDDADITITEAETVKIAQVLTGANVASTTSRTTYATTNHSVLDDIVANDTRSLTISVGSLTAATDVSGSELTFDAVTVNALEALTVSAGSYTAIAGGAIGSSSSSVQSVAITAADYGSVSLATADASVTASSATSLDSVTVTAGLASTVTLGNIALGSANIDAVSISTGVAGALTIADSDGGTISFEAGTIADLTIDLAAASGITFDASAVAFGASVDAATITFGASVVESISFGENGDSFGDFTLSGASTAGSASTFTFDGETLSSFDASAFGGKLVFDGSGMDGDIDSVVGSNQADSITGGAGNDSLSGGAGVDTLTGGAGDDTIVGGAGADIIVLTSTGTDTVNSIVLGASGDTITFDLSALEAAYTVDFANLDDGASTAHTEGSIQEVTADVAAGANKTFFVLVGATFANSGAVETAIETGDFEIGVHADVAANDAFIVVWSDGTDAYVSLAKVSVDGGADIDAGDLTITNLVKLVGNPSITADEFNAANFDFIA